MGIEEFSAEVLSYWATELLRYRATELLRFWVFFDVMMI